MADTNRKEGEWGVRDKNARVIATDGSGKTQPRTHEPAPGITYALNYDRPTFMPEEHARKFLKDPSFEVTDANDVPVASLSPNARLRKAPDNLPADMVIANLNELTDEALLTRVAQQPGGDRFNGGTPREVLVRFVMDQNTPHAHGPTGKESDFEVEEMPEDGQDADKLLTGS